MKPQSFHLQTYHILKQSILDGKRKPKERIIESQVASELGISRGPVREAIRMLIQDGLLIYNDGYVKVYEPNRRDVEEIFECREVLEVLAIRRVIERVNDTVLQMLYQNMEETTAVLHQSEQLKVMDQEFHSIIMEASGNHHLLQLLDNIKVKIQLLRNNMEDDFYPTLIADHEHIYNCIQKRNIEKAEQLIRNHIQKGMKDVLRVYT